ncbi:MAG: shikimate dehydrogenase [Candidatus Margulisbacteria bacterium]|nr:shikimate dehydrogenase [Candidatus Margulisiibacteriota bacterium]MBU1617627.1 shikimate dehydrogenase [Candidatus Margulisiibacteriota bacterium]MBU1867243.1 shikimate dehydrogenase [Candidatus Margulisiibacteriota bacterium]
MRKLIGLVGYPLGHSVSPAMHNAAFKALNIDYEYVPFEVDQYDLPQSVAGLRALHIAGFNVTVPHKETIVPLLDDVTKLAQVIGAVNTVQNQDGTLIGYNTDGPGFLESLREDAGFDPRGKEVVILGAGGASRAVTIMLTEAKVRSLVIADLDEDKAKMLASQAGSFSKVPCRHSALDSSDLNRAIASADLLVNTTPVGMSPKAGFSPLPADTALNPKTLIYDLVYNPAETAFIKQAKKNGCKTCSGLGMLVRQGGLAFTIFTGEEPPLEVMWEAARNGLKS